MKGKGCPTFGPLGPWLVTPDEIDDVQKLDMWLDVNGERMQNGSTATMIFGVKNLVSYISQFMILEPGDVITTGTPAGVGLGKKPPVFLKAGDTMSLGIDGTRPAGAAGRRLQGRVGGTAMRRLLSGTGLVLAAITALAFAALYLNYLNRAGTWFADLPLVLAALPFTLTMRALNGGTYDFAGDMTGRVVAAALFVRRWPTASGLLSKRWRALQSPRRGPVELRADRPAVQGPGTRAPSNEARGGSRN